MTGKGFRMTGKGFRMTGKGFRMTGKGFRMTGKGFRMTGKGFRMIGKGFRMIGSQYMRGYLKGTKDRNAGATTLFQCIKTTKNSTRCIQVANNLTIF